MIGRHEDAVTLFEKLLALRNDVGLLAEEYDSVLGRQVGNFPQAFSHISLVNSAVNLTDPMSWQDAADHRHIARAESRRVERPARLRHRSERLKREARWRHHGGQ